MIHQLWRHLSSTAAPLSAFFLFRFPHPLYLGILFLLFGTTLIDGALSLWVEGHVDSRFLMEPKIVFEVKIS